MKQRFNGLSLVVFIACALASCDAKIDLDNIDPSVKAEMGLAVPVGEFGITLGDLIPTNEGALSVNENGVYQLSAGYDFSYQIEDIDVSQYSATAEKTLFISQSLSGLPAIVGPFTLPLEFELKMGMEGVNQTLRDERIDSMRLTSATLIADIEQNFGLSANHIQKAELILSDDFHRSAGNTIDIPFTSFNTPTPVVLDNFSINFVKDPTLPAANDNVKDTLTMKLRLTLQLADGEMIMLDSGSKFKVKMNVRIDDYEAVYGRLVNNIEANLKDELDFSEMWAGLDKVDLNVSLYDPTISIDFTTGIAIPLRFHINELKSVSADRKEERKADFNGSSKYELSLPNYVKVTDSYDMTATNTIVLNRENGNIGRLFEITPAYFVYDLGIAPEVRDGSDQQRIVKGRNSFNASLNMSLPFAFDEGSSLSYSDVAEVDFSALSFEDVPVLDSLSVNELYLFLTLQNTLPFAVDASISFLGENKEKLVTLPASHDQIHIDGPTTYSINGPEPAESTIEIAVNNDMWKKLKDVRYIAYNVSAKDPNPSTYPLELKPENGLHIKIALAANVAAYLNLITNQK